MLDPDRVDEDYLQARQTADAEDLEQWWSAQLPTRLAPPTQAPVSPRALGHPQPQEAPQGLTAKVGQVFTEGARMAGGAVVDALTHTLKALEAGQEGWAGTMAPPGRAGETVTPSALIPQVPRAESLPLNMARDLLSIATTVAVASAAGAPPWLAGMTGDITAAAGMEGRLTDLVTQVAPGLKDTPIVGPLTRFLESQPGDSTAMEGFKNAVEGLLAGAILSGGVRAVRAGLHPQQTAAQITEAFRQLRDSPTGQLLRSEAGEVRLPGGGAEAVPPAVATPAAAPEAPRPQVHEQAVAELQLDPARFQYKVQTAEGGTTGSLAGVQTYDPNLAGIIQVWRDPADGQLYVVNGHNRVALAQRLGVEQIPVRELHVASAEEARTIGALTNIAEGRGSAIDAAKLFRDTGMDVAHLQARGVPLRERIAADGLALANLQDTLFDDLIQGRLPLERGIIIGSKITDPDQQLKLVELLRAEGRVNADTVREYADFVHSAPSQQVVQDTLFGAEETTQSLAKEKFRLAAAIREQISKDKTLFARVSKESAAQRLTEAGSVINIEESQRIAAESERLLNVFDRLKYRTGPIAEMLNEGAEQIKAGGNINDIRASTYQRLSEALPEIVRGADTDDTLRAVARVPVGEYQTSTGDLLTADASRTRGAVSAAGIPIRERPPEPSLTPAAAEPPTTPPPGGPPGTPPTGGGLPPLPPEPPPGPRLPPEAPAGRELLTGIPAEAIPPRVNVARLSAPERVKTVLTTVNQLNVESGATETAVRGVVSHRETLAAARGRVSAEDLIARQPGEMLPGIPLNEQITAARRLRVTSASYLEQLATRVTQGDQEAAGLLYDALAVHGKIDEAVTGMSAEVGRALEAHKIGARAERGTVDPAALGELADRLRGVLPSPVTGEGPGIPALISPERLAQMIQSAQRAAGRNGVDTMARQATSAAHRGVNMLMEAWINGLLSGPQTHAANVLSNTLTTFWAIPERALAARLHPGVDAGVMRGEATAMLYGLVNGMTDAFSLAARAFRSGEASFGGASKLEIPRAISGETLGLTGPVGRAVDLLGTAIRLPGRALLTGDELFKGLNYRMELHAQAYRQAAREGLEGAAMAQRLTGLLADPPASLKQAAEGFAFYQTFTNELGPTGHALMAFRESHPAMLVILPFVRTPINLFKYGVERMPVLSLLMEGVRHDLRAGGVRRDLALAKMSLGGLVLGTVGALAASGVISGDGPHDPDLKRQRRDTGWQPYSVKVGDTYYSYNRLDPIGNLMGIAANIAELSGELPRAELDQLAMAAVIGTMESMTSKTYLQGLANVLEAIKQPDQRGLNFLRSLTRSLIPAGVAQLERVTDPTIREVNGFIDELKARVPGYSDTLPPRRNLWGEPILLEGGLGPDLISPIYTSTATDDPVSAEISRLRLQLSMPSKYLGGSPPSHNPFAEARAGRGVELTPQEYDLYVRLAGNELKMGGSGLKDYLGELLQTPLYQQQSDGPDGGKALLIRRAVQTYRQAAALELRRRAPELDGLLRARLQERMEQRRPSPADAIEGLGIAR
jgi:hypothetical protein